MGAGEWGRETGVCIYADGLHIPIDVWWWGGIGRLG
jgi:hypothetical protein